MKKLITLFAFLFTANSCSLNNKNFFYKDINGFNTLIDQVYNNVDYSWGINEIIIPKPKDYLKYTNNYNLRSYISFDTGNIIVESISNKHLKKKLKQEIIKTILINKNPNRKSNYYNESLLLGQILDNYGNVINSYRSASKFADYLIKNKLKTRYSSTKIWTIYFSMTSNHLDKRAHKYLPIVYQASKKYKVNQSLILAIMQIESSFNPYAISHSDAVGLMQIMQKTAGADVFRFKGKFGIPSRNYLLNPEKNIDTGVAYISILQKNYLSGIINPISRLYAVITAYNGGVTNVLKTFANNKSFAFKKINSISPQKVYQKLIEEHPSEETRNYLYKVSRIQNKYNNFI